MRFRSSFGRTIVLTTPPLGGWDERAELFLWEFYVADYYDPLRLALLIFLPEEAFFIDKVSSFYSFSAINVLVITFYWV